jgi:hypothetical protein
LAFATSRPNDRQNLIGGDRIANFLTALTLFLLPAVCGLLLRRAKARGDDRAGEDRERPLRAAE